MHTGTDTKTRRYEALKAKASRINAKVRVSEDMRPDHAGTYIVNGTFGCTIDQAIGALSVACRIQINSLADRATKRNR